jgi:hypothetical protein
MRWFVRSLTTSANGSAGPSTQTSACSLQRSRCMDLNHRHALACRLALAEVELRAAIDALDGSLTSRTRYAFARQEYRAAEHAVILALGARDTLSLVEEREVTSSVRSG